jgi:imidazole glycerol-phosphate synthase
MGICVGMQALFASSEESPDVEGLAIVHPSINVSKFNSTSKAVPHMGWNAAVTSVTVSEENPKSQKLLNHSPSDNDTRYYFVHSYAVNAIKNIDSFDSDWSVAYTTYGDETFVSAIKRKNVFATQFHPEKSGMYICLIEKYI